MDNDSCNLYIHLNPANALQDISKIVTWLKSEYNATQIFPTSFFIDADELYEEDNVNSFIQDFTQFLGEAPKGLGIVICPTPALSQLFFSEDAQR